MSEFSSLHGYLSDAAGNAWTAMEDPRWGLPIEDLIEDNEFCTGNVIPAYLWNIQVTILNLKLKIRVWEPKNQFRAK